jgi:hypothetical protein
LSLSIPEPFSKCPRRFGPICCDQTRTQSGNG